VKVLVAGSGPNGLAAAVALAREGVRVVVRERAPVIGGGLATLPLTLPGFRHDLCAAVHPFAVASPFLRQLPLGRYGLRWVHHEVALAHPFDDGSAAVLDSLEATCNALDGVDAARYRRLMLPFVREWRELFEATLAPLAFPSRPWLQARFGRVGIAAMSSLGSRFEGPRARALLAGIAAHGGLPLERRPTAAFGLLLALAGHVVGWPIARGGSQAIADALVGLLQAHGGSVDTESEVGALPDPAAFDAVLLDVAPRALLRLAEGRLPARYARALARFRYGPGVCKVDWALDGPIPWRAEACRRAGTVHLGGSADEIAAALRAVWAGSSPTRPFVLLGQPTLADATRAPAGAHTAWAYCHVPAGSNPDCTAAIEAQVERFAPGFRELVRARRTHTPLALEGHNPNLVGGAVTGGLQDLAQLWFRPVPSRTPYRTPLPGVYLCSAATPPGGGVHGMCGWYAAQTALRDRR
jgi:phytoene dehydrogenase-like protein